MAADNQPPPEAIRTQLQQILNSSAFRSTDKQMKLIGFVVNEALEGRASKIIGVAGWHMTLYGEWERGLGTKKNRKNSHPKHIYNSLNCIWERNIFGVV